MTARDSLDVRTLFPSSNNFPSIQTLGLGQGRLPGSRYGHAISVYIYSCGSLIPCSEVKGPGTCVQEANGPKKRIITGTALGGCEMMVSRAPFLCSRYSSIRGRVESFTVKTSRVRIQSATVITVAAQERKAKGRRVRSRSSLATQGMAMDMQTDQVQTPFLSQSRYRALVLDPGMQPIDVVNWQRALVLDMLAKVEVLEYYQGVTVNSVSAEFFLPAVLMAKQVGRNASKFSRVPLNRRNIMIRDNLTCQYCGKKPSRGKVTNGLTLDHIVPQCRGGVRWLVGEATCRWCSLFHLVFSLTLLVDWYIFNLW